MMEMKRNGENLQTFKTIKSKSGYAEQSEDRHFYEEGPTLRLLHLYYDESLLVRLPFR
jgi:hypothetical protein